MSGNLQEAADVLTRINVVPRPPGPRRDLHAARRLVAGRGELLRKMLHEYPVGYREPDGTEVTAEDYRRTEMMLGNVLDRQALKRGRRARRVRRGHPALRQGLEKKYPNDKEVPAALGHVYLWSGERAANATDKDEAYAGALKQFHKVLTTKNWSSEPKSLASRGNVEQGFIDAAASAPTVTGRTRGHRPRHRRPPACRPGTRANRRRPTRLGAGQDEGRRGCARTRWSCLKRGGRRQPGEGRRTARAGRRASPRPASSRPPPKSSPHSARPSRTPSRSRNSTPGPGSGTWPRPS